MGTSQFFKRTQIVKVEIVGPKDFCKERGDTPLIFSADTEEGFVIDSRKILFDCTHELNEEQTNGPEHSESK